MVYRLPKPTPDGCTELQLTPLESPELEAADPDPVRDGSGADAPANLARIRWAVLLARIYRPPQGDFLFDQTPEFDAAGLEPVPDFLFDQSLPQDFCDG